MIKPAHLLPYLRSLPGRLLLGLLTINLVLGALLFAGVMHFISENFKSQFVNHVRSHAYALAVMVGHDTQPTRVKFVLDDMLLSGQVVSADFVAADGDLKDAAANPPQAPANFKEDLFFGEHSDNIYHVAMPVVDANGAKRGALFLGYDESMVSERITQAARQSSLFAAAYVGLLILLAGALGLFLSRPLGRLRSAAREIAAGHYDKQLAVVSNVTEISSLVTDLEDMRRELVRRGDEIAGHESKHRAVLENLAEGVFTISQNCQVQHLNPAARAMFGYSNEEAFGQLFYHFVVDEQQLKDSCPSLFNGATLMFTGKRKNGSIFPVMLSATSFAHGDENLMVVVAQDISERKAFEDQLTRMAYYDGLTGLPNRRLFHDRLGQALAQAERHQKLVAILFLDLDRFKNINDTLGHQIGDLLLQSVAERLVKEVRQCDTVARLGGDEFTIILTDIGDVADAEAIAQKIIASFSVPFMLDGHELFSSTSIGITLYPIDNHDIETLIKNADTAMYSAKKKGRNTYQFYTANMSAGSSERLAMEHALRKAVTHEHLVLHYQPQVMLHYQPLVERLRGEIVGMEALVRWQHPELGLIQPDSFIPLAEESGLIVPIGEWVVRAACEQNKLWQASGLPPMSIAVNLSPRQLQQTDIVRQIGQALQKTGMDPAYLELEITESMIVHNTQAIIATLREFKAMGIMISIDDFGTGHSSLSNLQQLPVDTVKIDRSFIQNLTTDTSSAAIANAVIDMARSMGLRVVAEGVETEEQMRYLHARQCDILQGFYFSRPVPAAEIESLIMTNINANNPLKLT